MKDYLNIINEQYGIRHTEKQKEDFRKFVINEVSDLSKYNAKVECLKSKHNNIIVGDLEKANFVFTAHYDTPYRCLWPNFIMPRRKVVSVLYHLAFPIAIALFSLLLAFCFNLIISGGTFSLVFMYLLIYFIFIVFAFQLVINKNNKNDNTSGVLCLFSLIEKLKDKENVCFVFFDNEEKGLLGSKEFFKKHKKEINDKLIINFDCIGEGKNILLIHKNSNEYEEILKSNIKSSGEFKVLHYPLKGSFGNSDYKSFKKSVGVMTCNDSKYGLYTSKIHTDKDLCLDKENIDFIVNEFSRIC